MPDIDDSVQSEGDWLTRRKRVDLQGSISGDSSSSSPSSPSASQSKSAPTIDISQFVQKNTDIDPYKKMVAGEPLKQDYQPSRLRSILGDIAGVGAGWLSHSIPGGENVADKIKYGPYYKDMKNYKQKEDILGRVAGITGSEQSAEAKDAAERAKAVQEAATGALRNTQAANIEGPGERDAWRDRELQARLNETRTDKQAAIDAAAKREDIIQQHEDTRATKREEAENKRELTRQTGEDRRSKVGIDSKEKIALQKLGKDLPPTQKIAVESDALNNLVIKHPEYREFVSQDPKTGKMQILAPAHGFLGMGATDMVKYNKFIEDRDDAIADSIKKSNSSDEVGEVQ